MITTKHRLLITSNKNIVKDLERFEAIELIGCFDEAEYIWSLNKTPVMVLQEKPPYLSEEQLEIPFDNINIEKFTKWCYSNGFEPGEYSTGIKIDTRVESCVLCSLVKHKGISEDTMIYNYDTTEVDLIVYESTNYIVVSELGSIKPGYLMILPKQHQYLSMALVLRDLLLIKNL